jgi:hypothetical protein
MEAMVCDSCCTETIKDARKGSRVFSAPSPAAGRLRRRLRAPATAGPTMAPARPLQRRRRGIRCQRVAWVRGGGKWARLDTSWGPLFQDKCAERVPARGQSLTCVCDPSQLRYPARCQKRARARARPLLRGGVRAQEALVGPW